MSVNYTFSALILLTGWQDGHLAWKIQPLRSAASCLAAAKIQNGLTFWYQLTQVVMETGR